MNTMRIQNGKPGMVIAFKTAKYLTTMLGCNCCSSFSEFSVLADLSNLFQKWMNCGDPFYTNSKHNDIKK